MYELRIKISKITYESKDDCKPIVFLFTDGTTTDDSKSAINEWKQNWQKAANLIVVPFGNKTNVTLLGELTDTMLESKIILDNTINNSLKWLLTPLKLVVLALIVIRLDLS
jgi:uncharacterized protein YegL